MKHISNIKKAEVEKTRSNSAFLDKLFEASSLGETENGALTYTQSGSALLDFFAQAGAMRKNPDAAVELFKKAFSENREIAIRTLFYLRDIRGGQGERNLFRLCLDWLNADFPNVFNEIIKYIPEYGRWDDVFFDNENCFKYLSEQLKLDESAEFPSLLAKWLPTMNASSKTTRAKARFVAKNLGLEEIEYRMLVRRLRKKIKTVEEKMSAQKWSDIEYSTVPSQAARIYKNAFKKHDEARYSAFIEKAEKGEVKINAATLYPYQIYQSARNDYSQTLEALWNQLPDYTQGKNALVVADVSGSMMGVPMSVSVSLALYFAERNTGQFKDHFITFSGRPKLQRISGKTLKEKMYSIERSEWEMNTNIQAVFKLILDTAIANKCEQSELPSTLYIISDMEFDQAERNHTSHAAIKEKYEEAGYLLPTIVFWNVDARNGQNLPTQKMEKNVVLVSGFSPSIFKMAVENKTPMEAMLDTVNSERYSKITITK